jgi:hypothetical protein
MQSAPAQQGDLAAERMQHLRRGINTSLWFAQAPGYYGVERLRSFTTIDDLALIRRMGFDHIRLSIDATPLEEWESGTPHGQDFMRELDSVVNHATGLGLAVIVDVHPEEGYKQQLLSGDDSIHRFVSLWRALARHYRVSNPQLVFFEVMNEPEQQDAVRWRNIEMQAAHAIRDSAPGHTIVATALHWSSTEDLEQMLPLDLDDVIYTFHDYEPFPFTHQGATWTMREVRPLRGVPYPLTAESVAPILSQEPDAGSQHWLSHYAATPWDAARVQQTISLAAAWGKEHHVPVYCGEFGVLRLYAPPADRARWLRDMRMALEANGIGWAMWDYQTDFGIVTKARGSTTPDPAIVDALGLTPTKN